MILLVASVALAQQGQFRRVQTSDGRTLYVEVVGQTPEGLEVRLAQGTAVVAYDEITGLLPVDAEAFATAPRWSVCVVDEGDLATRLGRHFEAMPGVDLVPVDRLVPPEAVARCANDASCLAESMPEGEWGWFVSIQQDRVQSTAGLGLPARHLALLDTTDDALWVLAHQALGLNAAAAPAPATVAPPPPPPDDRVVPPPDAFAQRNASAWDARRVDRLSVVPVPGLAALRMGDGEHFAVALLTAVPATVGFAYATGAATDDHVEGAVVGALGGWAIVTAVNQITGRRALAVTAER